jgi:Na+/proline symporter/CheY-like chemotaxis protein/anti-sigma regulatory factor (Ser/Thr protein kinase)
MIPGWVLLLVSLAYVALLFAVAYAGDRRPVYPQHRWLRPLVYSFALAVYCSSWTFYGAVGSAVNGGWTYLPIYLGPILLFLFFPGVLRRLIQIAREQNITSIADFLGSRFGKSPALAALVTLIALFAAVPYLALQFKAGAMSIAVLSGGPPGQEQPVLEDSALYLAMILALFGILFGTRHVDATEHHHGLMLAVALESLVKLAAFIAVGVFAIYRLPDDWSAVAERAALAAPGLPPGFFATTLLAMLAMFCLPRQFQVGVVECEEPRDLEKARWIFPAYLAVISVLVVPIAFAGLAAFGANGNPDSFVLRLPMAENRTGLALLVYLGGFSAATGMVIVASVALATMVSNDLVMPALLRSRRWQVIGESGDLSRLVLGIRRATILGLALAAFAWYRASDAQSDLASIGLLAFAAVAQFAPPMLAGLYWSGASRVGAIGGLCTGFAVWGWTLLLPALAGAGWISGGWMVEGPFGVEWLRPRALFGLSGWDPVTHGAVLSLLFNIGALILLSLRYRPGLGERLRAQPFIDPWRERPSAASGELHGRIRIGDLQTIAARIIGPRTTDRAFADFARASGQPLNTGDRADRALMQYTERLLAGAIGGASARRVLTTVLRGTGLDLGEVVSLLDETSQELRFNRTLLAATLENLSQGVSVVDADMRLVAWNRRYVELFDYPEGMIYVGRSAADLIRWNAERGECGPGEIEAHVAKRIGFMQQGSAYMFERHRPDGTVLEMRGQPMPGGGFVTSFTDITEYKRTEQALRDSKDTLEHRVTQRTAELREALDAQRAAKQEAEAANLSKTRFLAAASHDLLQPLNAARLFASALGAGQQEPQEMRALAQRIDGALRSAEELLDGLLDVSRLDSGALKPEPVALDLHALLQSLHDQFAPVAEGRGLALRLHCPRGFWVTSDRTLLRRVLQNFVANALRYTSIGGVLLAARRRRGMVEVTVWDTGPGISMAQAAVVFDEFRRLDQPSPWGETGLGLGLSICKRVAGMLGHPLTLRSVPGRGSVFGLQLPTAAPVVLPSLPAPIARDVAGLGVLCIDDDPDILEGMRLLLGRWQVEVRTASGLEQALRAVRERAPDLVLADFQLGEALDGLAVLEIVRREAGPACRGALVTADRSEELDRRARDAGYPVLPKPVKPAALRALIAALGRRPSGADTPDAEVL